MGVKKQSVPQVKMLENPLKVGVVISLSKLRGGLFLFGISVYAPRKPRLGVCIACIRQSHLHLQLRDPLLSTFLLLLRFPFTTNCRTWLCASLLPRWELFNSAHWLFLLRPSLSPSPSPSHLYSPISGIQFSVLSRRRRPHI